MYPIVESSPKALDVAEDYKASSMPFDKLEVGKSFLIPLDQLKEQSVRNAATKAAKKLGWKFSVVKHEEPNNVYEVARIA